MSTTALITLQAAKDHLNMDHDLSDVDIQNKILEASLIVLDYLKLASIPDSWSSGAGSTDSPSGNTTPENIQAAVKLVLGELWKNRESSTAVVLSDAVKSLLHRSRHPALA